MLLRVARLSYLLNHKQSNNSSKDFADNTIQILLKTRQLSPLASTAPVQLKVRTSHLLPTHNVMMSDEYINLSDRLCIFQFARGGENMSDGYNTWSRAIHRRVAEHFQHLFRSKNLRRILAKKAVQISFFNPRLQLLDFNFLTVTSQGKSLSSPSCPD